MISDDDNLFTCLLTSLLTYLAVLCFRHGHGPVVVTREVGSLCSVAGVRSVAAGHVFQSDAGRG